MGAAGILPVKQNRVKPKDEAWAVAIRLFCFYDRESTAVKKIFAFCLP